MSWGEPKKVESEKAGEVLVLSEDYPPRVVGGVGSHVYDLATGLAARRWSVRVLATGTRQLKKEQGVRLCRIPFYRAGRAAALLRTQAIVRQCLHLTEGSTVDLIHLHDPMYVSVARELRKILGAPVLFTQHNVFRRLLDRVARGDPDLEKLQPHLCQESRAEAEAMRTAEAVICVSEIVRRELEQVYRSLPPLRVIANGVDIERFRRVNPVRLAHLRETIGGTSKPIVLFAGRSNSGKGLPELLMATSLVAQREPGVRFVFALSDGEPHQLSAWRQMLPAQDCAVLCGNVARDEIPLYFRAADLVVMPSRSESFGLVALEALAAGKPLIVSDVEPLNQFVTDGLNGRVVPLAEGDKTVIDVRALAETILHLVRLPPGERERMGERGLEIVRASYSKDTMVDRTISFYRWVIARSRRWTSGRPQRRRRVELGEG